MIQLRPAINEAFEMMEGWGELVHTEKWQSLDVSQKPEAQMVEVLHHQLKADLRGEMDVHYYHNQIQPNLPWAENHFQERICGYPINPGTEWKNWPWSSYAEKHVADKFNHNYMERYWPKKAHLELGPQPTSKSWHHELMYCIDQDQNMKGIKHEYGDLDGVIGLLAFEPTTRQAYMPIWFPEDTGTTHKGRKPCTLGYHFIMRNNRLDIRYDIRSCDMYRHFRDDIYLTIRLGLHILECCKRKNPDAWKNVVPGTFIMNITSLHMFISDYTHLFKHGLE